MQRQEASTATKPAMQPIITHNFNNDKYKIMKKIILSAIAMLAFGIASAQTEPKTPPVAPTPPSPQVTPEEKKANADANMQNQIPQNSQQRMEMDGAQPRKDVLKTQDHVKSTPDPEAVKNNSSDVKTEKRSKRKKTS